MIAIAFFLIIIIIIFNSILKQQVVKKTAQLSKSEEQFRSFAENVPGVVSIYQWYPDGHREYIYQGPGLENIIGEELAKKTDEDPDEYFKLIQEEDFNALDEASLKALETNKHLDFEYRLVIDDSNIKWVRALFSMLPQQNEVILWQGIVYDITKQKQIEEALKESEAKYKTLYETTYEAIFVADSLHENIYSQMFRYSPFPILIHDMEMNIIDANMKAIEEFGYPKEELLKKKVTDLHTLTELEHSSQVLENMQQAEMMNVETSFMRKDGTERKQAEEELLKHRENLEALVSERTAELKNTMVKLEEKITERKQAEEALKESEYNYRILFDNVGDGIFVLDAETMKIVLANKEIIKMYGLEPEENISNINLIDLVLPEYEEAVYKIITEDMFKNDLRQTNEFRSLTKDGREIWINAVGVRTEYKGRLAGLISLRDITKRKRTEKIQKTLYNISNALNTAEDLSDLYSKIRDFLENVIDTTNFYVALYDEKTDLISLPFNIDEKDEFETFPAGKTLTSLVIKTGKPLFAPKQLQDELNKQGKIEIIGTRSEIWIGVPLKIENKVIGVIAVQSYDDPNLYTEKDIEILTFVSEGIALAINHKKADEQIKRDLKEKNLLLKEIHHRTKNNLQTISSMMQMQEDTIRTKEDALKGFKVTQDRIGAMAKSYEILLRSEYMSEIKLNDYITELTDQLARNYDIHGKVTISYSLEDIMFDAEKLSKIGLILNEIVTNAIKYAFEGRDQGNIHIKLEDAKENIKIKISDDGIGIPENIKIPNTTTLGLSLVDMLIGEFHGTYSVGRKNGTCFTLKIPH